MLILDKRSILTDADRAKVQAAIDLGNRVLSSARFQALVRASTRENGTPGFEGTADTGDDVLRRLTTGDASIVISVESYSWLNFAKRHEVAHENPDGGVVLNRKFFAVEDLTSLTNTIVHEVCHVKGYTHDHARTARRPFSVPYGVGNIAQRVAMELTGAVPVPVAG